MKRFVEYAIIGVAGGIYYYFLEILWRGYSHPAMIAVGGASALSMYVINKRIPKARFVSKCIAGASVITVIELISGVALNLWLRWDIWDYSKLKYHLLGQISLRTSLLWLLLCVPAYIICDLVKEIFGSKGEKSGKEIKKA